MTSPGARLFRRQMAYAGQRDGGVDLDRLGQLVISAYGESEADQRRTRRAAEVMAAELEEVNATLEQTVTALRAQNLRFGAALDNMANGLALFGPDGNLVVSNRRQFEILGIDPERVPAQCDLQGFLQASGVISERLLQDHLSLAEARDGHEGELQQTLLDNRDIRVVLRRTADGGFLTSCEDVTERNRAVARIAFLAYHDTLTKLPNRVLLRERLEERLRLGECAVLCLDLDGFKTVNDTLGHPMGDALLREVTARLSRQVRAGETLARLGGDEFAAVIDGGMAEAAAIAGRMIDVVSAQYAIAGNILRISTSIGIAVAPADGRCPEDLLRHADMALYRAKAEGRRCFRAFEASMGAAARQRQGLEQDLSLALAAGQFTLHYQSRVAVGSGEITGFEALVRWNHPERGLIAPGAFIAVAEESGLITGLGEWVLYEACRAAAAWPDPIGVSVNVSPVQLRNAALFKVVTGALAASGLAPDRLELEVTETAMLNDSGAVLSVMRRLRALGVRIVLDDFGTGFSSLTHLHSFLFDGIKIDRSFIQDLEHEPKSLAIVRAVIGLGVSLNIPVIAEGVETRAQLAILAREQCQLVQGFLFSRPVPEEAVSLSRPARRLAAGVG